MNYLSNLFGSSPVGYVPVVQRQRPQQDCFDRVSKIATSIILSLATFLLFPPPVALLLAGGIMILAVGDALNCCNDLASCTSWLFAPVNNNLYSPAVMYARPPLPLVQLRRYPLSMGAETFIRDEREEVNSDRTRYVQQASTPYGVRQNQRIVTQAQNEREEVH